MCVYGTGCLHFIQYNTIQFIRHRLCICFCLLNLCISNGSVSCHHHFYKTVKQRWSTVATCARSGQPRIECKCFNGTRSIPTNVTNISNNSNTIVDAVAFIVLKCDLIRAQFVSKCFTNYLSKKIKKFFFFLKMFLSVIYRWLCSCLFIDKLFAMFNIGPETTDRYYMISLRGRINDIRFQN